MGLPRGGAGTGFLAQKVPDKAFQGNTMQLIALLLATFGATGAYERVIGVAKGELDPEDPRNTGIAGLAMAPRNAAGKVEYETYIFLLRPAPGGAG